MNESAHSGPVLAYTCQHCQEVVIQIPSNPKIEQSRIGDWLPVVEIEALRALHERLDLTQPGKNSFCTILQISYFIRQMSNLPPEISEITNIPLLNFIITILPKIRYPQTMFVYNNLMSST